MSIYADRRNGKLNGWFRVEVTVDGRRARGRAKTYAEAEVLEGQLIQQLQTPDLAAEIARARAKEALPTLGDLVKQAKGHVWRGMKSEALIWKAYVSAIVSLLGEDTPLVKLSTERMDWLLEQFAAKGWAAGTINLHFAYLSKLLKWARRRKLVANLPEFPWQALPPGRKRTMTPEEEAAIWAWFEARGLHVVADFLRVLGMTGMRRSEAYGLKPEDIQPGYARLWITKNGDVGSVALLPEAEAILRNRLPWAFRLRTLGYWWVEMRKDLGLEHDTEFVVHALRHTFGTRMVNANVHINVIQAAMRHRSIKSTLRYAHVRQDIVRDAVLTMGNHMKTVGADGGVKPKGASSSDTQGPKETLEEPWLLVA